MNNKDSKKGHTSHNRTSNKYRYIAGIPNVKVECFHIRLTHKPDTAIKAHCTRTQYSETERIKK